MTAKQSIAWLQAAWKDDKKRINLLLVSGLAGMLLLCMSEWLPAGQSTQNAAQSSQQSQTAAEYEQQLETRLAALIRAMDGAGETVVMVTLDCGEETTYAADTRTEKTSEDTRSSAASQRTHLLAGAQPVVQSVQAPQVRGVAVLCQGGGNAGTQRRITELVSALTGWFPGLQFIAEDLGYPTPEVAQLLRESGWPGMKVLEFAFDSRDSSGYLPHAYTPHCICYTGTHDNSPLALWRQEAAPEDVAHAVEYLALTEQEGFHWGIIRGGMSSVAELFVAQMQDYLGLGEGNRMNIPGTQGGNWTWRLLPGELSDALSVRIDRMTALYGRKA